MKDLFEIIIDSTKKAIYQSGDKSTKRFYDELKNHKFMTTHCLKCQKPFFPPRVFCPQCYGHDLEWIELSGKGKIYAFSQQERAIRFMKPDVLGLVELEEGIGRIMTRIDAKIEDLKIGQDVVISFIDIGGGITLHQFKPAD